MLAATYFDGRSPRAQPVRLAVQADQLVVADERTVLMRTPLANVRLMPAAGSAPRRIDLAAGGVLEVADHAGLASMLAGTGVRVAAPRGAARGIALMLGAVLVTVAAALLLVRWAIPLASGWVVAWVPVSVDAELGERAWPALEQSSLAPSTLAPARQQALRERFAAVAAAGPGVPYMLEFRSGSLGANALALPGGRIVFTDALVALASDDDALAGVFAHELGHVAGRHAMRTLLQNAALGALVALWLGDVSPIVAGLPAMLADLEYSRALEHEADGHAIALMAAAGRPTSPMADLLERIEASAPQARAGGLWSSHPVTGERVRRLREADRRLPDGRMR